MQFYEYIHFYYLLKINRSSNILETKHLSVENGDLPKGIQAPRK